MLPVDWERPRVPLVMNLWDMNAIYNGYALYLPVAILGDVPYGPVTISEEQRVMAQQVTAHEYGHAVITRIFSRSVPALARLNAYMENFGKIMTESNEYMLQKRRVSERIRTAYMEKNGISGRLTDQQLSEFYDLLEGDAAYIEAKSGAESTEEAMGKLRDDFDPVIDPKDLRQLGYQELFADLLEVLSAKDWRAASKFVESVLPGSEQAVACDFTDSRNDLSQWKDSAEPHLIFAPARYFIWKRVVVDSGCADPEPRILLEAVADAVVSECLAWEAKRPSWTPRQQNQSLLAALNRALNRETINAMCSP